MKPQTAQTGQQTRIHVLGMAILCTSLLLSGCGKGNDGDTYAPLSEFVRINADGSDYQGNANFAEQPWACIHDRFTGLLWEVKLSQQGLQFKDNTYTWHKPGENERRGDSGVANGGSCTGSLCDTSAYVAAINAMGLCGYSDWRIPERMELGTLIDRRNLSTPPTIQQDFFPNTNADEYWTWETYDPYFHGAWTWNFVFGYDRVDWKKTPKHLRLVRGEIRADIEKVIEEKIESRAKYGQ